MSSTSHHKKTSITWYPWGNEAFAQARALGRPVLVSIGSSSCHHSQVMHRDCFLNSAVVKKLNRDFICIEVDKYERPDVDRSFQNVAVALSGRGGWPLSIFLTPGGEPFFAANFLSRDDQPERPGFVSLLKRIGDLWNDDRESLVAQAKRLSEHLKSRAVLPDPRPISEDALRACESALRRDFDPSFGGFGRAPKFPPISALNLLLRRFRRSGDSTVLEMVTRSLDGMMTGGLYDHLAGGFFRYSVDRSWARPRFEKLLAENALLARLYLEAFQVTKFAPYRRVVVETLEFLLREMQSPTGGFFSALSAESENQEGKYYLLDATEVEEVVGKASAGHFCAFFGIDAKKSVPQIRTQMSEVAELFAMHEEDLKVSIEDSRAQLLIARQDRVAPDLEDTLVSAHNGYALDAFAFAGMVLGESRYLECAQRIADSLLWTPKSEGGHLDADFHLYRESRAGEVRLSAFLEDYAVCAQGLLTLHEAGAGHRYLELSKNLTEALLENFKCNGSSALKFSRDPQETLLITDELNARDSSVGNETATVILLLSRLAAHTDRSEWTERAKDLAVAFGLRAHQDPRSYCALLCAVDSLLDPHFGVVVCNLAESKEDTELLSSVFSQYSPNQLILRTSLMQKDVSALPTLLRENEQFSLQLFQGSSCKPVSERASLLLALAEQEEWRDAERRSELGRKQLPGRATTAGTDALERQSRLPSGAYRKWENLSVSRLGIGGHRLGIDLPSHREAVLAALRGGINLIDTSPSFAFGDSERVIGKVIEDLVEAGELCREGLVVISKVGVLLGDEADVLAGLSQSEDGALPEGAVPLQAEAMRQERTSQLALLKTGAFCISPRAIRRQITRSLSRLGLAHIDFCLVQSPEHLLNAGGSRKKLRSLLLRAFETLEQEITAGRIGAYGVQSNTVAQSEQPSLRIELDWLLSIAEEAGKQSHHFRLIEVPINLQERGAFATSNSNALSLVETARARDVAVLATRPLSCFMEGALLRLSEPKISEDGASADSLKKARYRVASLEAEFETTLAVQLRLSKMIDGRAVLPVSGALGGTLEKVRTREQFDLAEATLFTPQLRQLIAQLDTAFRGSSAGPWIKFREHYIKAVGTWLAAVREMATEENRRLLGVVDESLASDVSSPFSAYAASRTLPWQQRALHCVIDAEGVSAALVGLRSPDQVENALKTLGKE